MRLFRYLDAKGLLLSVVERRLRVSRVLDLNDPFEWRFGVTGMPPESRADMESVIQQCITELGNRAGFICFSASSSESVLWSHYADRHRGGVLELEIAVDPQSCIMVEYEDGRPTFAAEEILSADPIARERVFRQFWGRKSKGWAYEQEYRFYISLDQCPRSDGMYYVTLKPTMLRKVILGWRSVIEVETMRRLLLGAGYCDSVVTRARPAELTYVVEC